MSNVNELTNLFQETDIGVNGPLFRITTRLDDLDLSRSPPIEAMEGDEESNLDRSMTPQVGVEFHAISNAAIDARGFDSSAWNLENGVPALPTSHTESKTCESGVNGLDVSASQAHSGIRQHESSASTSSANFNAAVESEQSQGGFFDFDDDSFWAGGGAILAKEAPAAINPAVDQTRDMQCMGRNYQPSSFQAGLSEADALIKDFGKKSGGVDENSGLEEYFNWTQEPNDPTGHPPVDWYLNPNIVFVFQGEELADSSLPGDSRQLRDVSVKMAEIIVDMCEIMKPGIEYHPPLPPKKHALYPFWVECGPSSEFIKQAYPSLFQQQGE